MSVERAVLLVVGTLIIVSVLACAPAPEVCEPQPFPAADWTVGAPEDHGFDAEKLDAAATYAGEHSSRCLLVVRHGVLVGEWYWHETKAADDHCHCGQHEEHSFHHSRRSRNFLSSRRSSCD